MQKKWLVTVGLALAAIALVVGAMLTKPKANAEKPAAEKPVASSQQPPASSIATTQTPSRPRGGARPTTATPPSAAGGTQGQPPAGAPSAGPAKPGETLAALSQPPAKTLAMLDEDAATANSRYSVSFQPYGTAAGNSLVIYVTKSQPVGRVPKPYDFAKRNVLVRVTFAQVSEAVSKGGSYTGTIELREQGGLLTPYLVDARGNG